MTTKEHYNLSAFSSENLRKINTVLTLFINEYETRLPTDVFLSNVYSLKIAIDTIKSLGFTGRDDFHKFAMSLNNLFGDTIVEIEDMAIINRQAATIAALNDRVRQISELLKHSDTIHYRAEKELKEELKNKYEMINQFPQFILDTGNYTYITFHHKNIEQLINKYFKAAINSITEYLSPKKEKKKKIIISKKKHASTIIQIGENPKQIKKKIGIKKEPHFNSEKSTLTIDGIPIVIPKTHGRNHSYVYLLCEKIFGDSCINMGETIHNDEIYDLFGLDETRDPKKNTRSVKDAVIAINKLTKINKVGHVLLFNNGGVRRLR